METIVLCSICRVSGALLNAIFGLDWYGICSCVGVICADFMAHEWECPGGQTPCSNITDAEYAMARFCTPLVERRHGLANCQGLQVRYLHSRLLLLPSVHFLVSIKLTSNLKLFWPLKCHQSFSDEYFRTKTS